MPFQTRRKTHIQSLEKTPDMYANKPEIISELIRLGLFPDKPEAETDLRSQAGIHHGSVGFGGIEIKFIHIALFSIYTSASFQVKYPRMNKDKFLWGSELYLLSQKLHLPCTAQLLYLKNTLRKKLSIRSKVPGYTCLCRVDSSLRVMEPRFCQNFLLALVILSVDSQIQKVIKGQGTTLNISSFIFVYTP